MASTKGNSPEILSRNLRRYDPGHRVKTPAQRRKVAQQMAHTYGKKLPKKMRAGLPHYGPGGGRAASLVPMERLRRGKSPLPGGLAGMNMPLAPVPRKSPPAAGGRKTAISPGMMGMGMGVLPYESLGKPQAAGGGKAASIRRAIGSLPGMPGMMGASMRLMAREPRPAVNGGKAADIIRRGIGFGLLGRR